MKSTKYLFIILLVSFTIGSAFLATEGPQFVQRLKDQLQEYNSNYPEEKVYLQFDKPFYKPGEDIWFNAFVLNSNTHRATTTSDVVYVELVDPKGNAASQLSLVIKEGTAHGDFTIQETAPGGIYHIRAYTQWMKNFGKENIFQKEVQVQRIFTPRLLMKLDFEKESYGPGDNVTAELEITNLKNEKVDHAEIRYTAMIDGNKLLAANTSSNDGKATISFQLPNTLNTTDGLLQVIAEAGGVEESISRSIPIVLNQITMQFFPEGGHSVLNADATIAFKAVNEFGKGADVSGIVVDESGKEITAFESFHMGMGAFRMKPMPAKKYFAKIIRPAGNESLIPLPESMESGFTLQLKNQSSTETEWSIHSPLTTDAHLVGQAHGEIVYASTIKLNKGENILKVPAIKFAPGIGVFTLFDYSGVEQCERLAFLQKEKGLNVSVKTDKKSYKPREKVQLHIKTTDNNGKPTASKISLAVVDDKLISFADDKQDNILSSMLLSSEVRGEIQEPSFYFDENEPKAEKALDYLLMTQGWRRFNWKEVRDMQRPIAYNPEKVKNITGKITHDGTGFKSEITLVELGNHRRIDQIETTENGHFVFKNIDPTIPVLLLAKKPGVISIQKEEAFAVLLNDTKGSMLLPAKAEVASLTLKPADIEKKKVVESEAGLNLTLDDDVSQLEEVVVTGYGVENKSSLTGSVTTIYESGIATKLPFATVDNFLQGRVAGVVVQPQMANPGSGTAVRIRGSSSLAARSEPLYVVDGNPIGTSLNQNFSTSGILGPEEISSIEVIASPEATSIFGSAAANGAILITTKSHAGPLGFRTKRKVARYNGLTIQPRIFSPTREFYVAPPQKNKIEKRTDFRSTVHWSPTIVTNEKGEAQLTFYNNDAVSSFRITAEGFSGAGSIGRAEEVYYTQLPFSLDTKVPTVMGFEDTLRLPIQIRNETSTTLPARIKIEIPFGLRIDGATTRDITVKAGTTETYFFTVTPTGIEGEYPITVKLESDDFKDKIENTIRVTPVGYPVRISFSSQENDKTVRFSIHDAEKNTLTAKFSAFPDVISDLFTGAEAILQEPHGCFEQTSSSTFPNVLALQFLRQSGQARPAVQDKAMKYIRQGYSRLVSYEVRGGGFDWFGHPPANEGLTAYGLVEFHEMKKVFPGVDAEMIERTRRWLLSRRDGNGGFQTGYKGHRLIDDVVNAYAVYALTETGTTDILPEYSHSFDEAMSSEDMYRLGLMACASYNLNKMENYHKAIELFRKRLSITGFKGITATSSIVYSDGISLSVETISLWTIALLKAHTPDMELIHKCLERIVSFRHFGQFGSTQATVLALKALCEYGRMINNGRGEGDIRISVGGKVADEHHYKKDATEKIVLNMFAQKLNQNGENDLEISFGETEKPLPYSVDIQWYTKKPQPDDRCKVSLSTKLSDAAARVNETVRLKTVLKNKTAETLPMVTVVIGIPAGMTAQPWQLKELQEKKVFDFYEIQNGKLNIYYRAMEAEESRTIDLDLKAEIPGKYTAAASSAYLYYTKEHKDWAAGNTIEILQ